jgi:hypothetical protein
MMMTMDGSPPLPSVNVGSDGAITDGLLWPNKGFQRFCTIFLQKRKVLHDITLFLKETNA